MELLERYSLLEQQACIFTMVSIGLVVAGVDEE
jgi:hypothetical protein